MNNSPYSDPHKDEYLEDPLPDLVGTTVDEAETDTSSLTDFVLEDFELTVGTSDEYSSDESDLEFFDVTNADLPEHENVSVELLDESSLAGQGEDPGSSNTTRVSRQLDSVKVTSERVVARVKALVGKRKGLKQNIRVFYHNLDKPYTARVSPSLQYKKYLTLGQETNSLGGMSGSSSINDNMGSPIEMGMTAEELEIARQEWQAELNQIEEEIQTLRQVLTAKTRRSHELKRKLGVTVWNEFTSDMNQGIKNVRESTAQLGFGSDLFRNKYQKTESAIKATAEKTTSLLGGLGSAVSQKIGALKNTDSFRSMEERVSSAVSTVKTKMGGSRSGSVQSFDDALREATANQADRPNGTPTPVATPVNEEKPLS